MTLHPATPWLSLIFFRTIATMEAVIAGIIVLFAARLGFARRQIAVSGADVDVSAVRLAGPTTWEFRSRALPGSACEQDQLCWRGALGKRKRRSRSFEMCRGAQLRKVGKQIIEEADSVGGMFASSKNGPKKKEGMKIELMAAASHGDL